MTKPEARGLRVTKHQAHHIVRGRALIQPPTEAEADMVAANSRTKHQTIEGIPFDVRMTLQALRDLAEQGNVAARWLYEREAARWDLHGELLLVKA